MSIGPPALGNVLVQRLDAVLGTTMAAHANLLTGARPDAVGQPGEAARAGQTENATRDPRQPVDGVGARGDRQAAVVDAKTAAALALAARGLVTRSDTTASAPTTLGTTARIILSLLAQYPEAAPAAQGRAPLWTPPGAPASPAPAAPGGPVQGGQPASSVPASAAPAAAPASSTSAPAPATAHTSAAQGAQPAALPSPAVFAQALRQSLQTSGLFYESHLTDMVYGQRQPETLRAEPQASLPRAPQITAPPPSLPAPASPSPTSSAVLTLSAQADTGPPPAPGTPIGGLHPDTNALVRQQLEILANSVVHWQGQPWPGAEMDWEVRRDPYGESPQDPDSHWATRLTLRLPRLGEVEARLSLAGSQLVLQLTAPQSAGELNRESEALRQQLTRAGLTLSDLTVQAMAPSPFPPPDFLLPEV